MKSWQDIENVVVVGLGITGASVVRYLNKYQTKTHVKVTDTRSFPPGKSLVPEGTEIHSGSWNSDWLLSADLVIITPGVPLTAPEIQTVVSQGIPVVGDIEIFSWHVSKPVVAVTGSNGKSTVADMAGCLLRSTGLKVEVGGNIGFPALDLFELDCDLYVLELSSFQLETTSSLSVKAAAFLNLSEDHMDRYDSISSYRQAKLRIFSHADVAIVNSDDASTYPETFLGKVVSFSTNNDYSDYCLRRLDGCEWLVADGRKVLATRKLRLMGRHNLANVLTVLALVRSIGMALDKSILDTLMFYRGLPHRCQLVESSKEVLWINDSKATNVASTIAALSSPMCRSPGTLFLLVGGIAKDADLSPLSTALRKDNLKLCCFGSDGYRFLEFHQSAVLFPTMEAAIQAIHSELLAGDIVMLSPACSSKDQFKSFLDRGNTFTKLAHQYA